jgi:hypothetical protein
MGKLNVKALAIALGVAWAFMMLSVGWASIFGWGAKFVEMMASVYIGFSPTFWGGLIGAVWGFVDGAIGGVIIALIYNAAMDQ